MADSPYKRPGKEPVEITRELVKDHPLDFTVLRDAAITAWEMLWETRVGTGETAVPIHEFDVPSMVIGYLFEVLLARTLELRLPGTWRGSRAKDEKDLVCVNNPKYSIEMKSSGQPGFKIFGNRSYGRPSTNVDAVKKEKSGYYITANFYKRTLTLLRFGWIDSEDWLAQASETGQMSGLKPEVYTQKLVDIPGDYRKKGPVHNLKKVGEHTSKEFEAHGITSIGELIDYPHSLPPKLRKFAKLIKTFCDAVVTTVAYLRAKYPFKLAR